MEDPIITFYSSINEEQNTKFPLSRTVYVSVGENHPQIVMILSDLTESTVSSPIILRHMLIRLLDFHRILYVIYLLNSPLSDRKRAIAQRCFNRMLKRIETYFTETQEISSSMVFQFFPILLNLANFHLAPIRCSAQNPMTLDEIHRYIISVSSYLQEQIAFQSQE